MASQPQTNGQAGRAARTVQPRRDHHGRQRPLGAAARPAARRPATAPAPRTSAGSSKACVELGIEVLTLYAFSTENWRAPERRGRTALF